MIKVNDEQDTQADRIRSPLPTQVEGLATARPWQICGATIIWSPIGKSNVAAVSDPRPPKNTSVGYYEIHPWDDRESDVRFREACANATLIVTAVNEYADNKTKIEALTAALRTLYDHQQRISSIDTRWEDPVYVQARAALALIESPTKEKN